MAGLSSIGMMRPLVVVERDPISDSAAGVSETFEALAVNALLFERADQSLRHSVVLTLAADHLLGPQTVLSWTPALTSR